ncbi:MAG: hypothetical protein Q7T05_06425, partial [Dehalococcoidia bacterium]|nr:hypothetical protein [Dehalococcoidia bacterium]
LKSSIGAGIASVGSELKGTLSTEVSIRQSIETTEELTFSAPACGRYSALVYQLFRHWKFQFKDERFFHRASWTKTVVEATEYYHDASKKTKNDPDCGCSQEPDAGIDGQLYLDAGSVGIVAGFIAGNNRLILPRLGHEFSSDFLSSDEPTVLLDAARLPEYLRLFIAARGEIRARVARYEERWGPETADLLVETDIWDLSDLRYQVERQRGEFTSE